MACNECFGIPHCRVIYDFCSSTSGASARIRRSTFNLDGDLLDECVLAKNVLTAVHGSSPYQALLGRVPPPMADLQPASATALDDDDEPYVKKRAGNLQDEHGNSLIAAWAPRGGD